MYIYRDFEHLDNRGIDPNEREEVDDDSESSNSEVNNNSDDTDDNEDENDDLNEGPRAPDPRPGVNNARQERNDEEANEPLYEGAEITWRQSMLLILTILLKHNVTFSGLADIISVVNLHCPRRGLKKNSFYKFNNYFTYDDTTSLIKHFYCSTCTRELEAVNDICPTCPRKKNSYFVRLPFPFQEIHQVC